MSHCLAYPWRTLSNPTEESAMDLRPAHSAAACPKRPPSVPARFGTLLLQYCDVRADGGTGELLTLPKAVGEHLRRILAGAGYVTMSPQLGFFAGNRVDAAFEVVARPPGRTSIH
jgi:hypothetical protein